MHRLHQRLGLVDIGHRLAAPTRRRPRRQDLQPGLMPVRELPRRKGRSGRGTLRRRPAPRHTGPTDAATQRSSRRPRRAPPSRARGCGATVGPRRRATDSAGRETVEGRLVARRRRDRRARPEKRGVSSDDLVGRFEQQPCRPQVVGEVMAACLEFGRQTAIGDQHGIVGELRTPRSATATISPGQPLGPITAATRQRHGGASAGSWTYQAICSANTAEYHRRDSALSVAPRRKMRVASGDTPDAAQKLTLNDCDRK